MLKSDGRPARLAPQVAQPRYGWDSVFPSNAHRSQGVIVGHPVKRIEEQVALRAPVSDVRSSGSPLFPIGYGEFMNGCKS